MVPSSFSSFLTFFFYLLVFLFIPRNSLTYSFFSLSIKCLERTFFYEMPPLTHHYFLSFPFHDLSTSTSNFLPHELASPHEWVLPPCSFVHDVPSSKGSQTPFVMLQILLSHFINKLPSPPFPSKVHERLTIRLFKMELVE